MHGLPQRFTDGIEDFVVPEVFNGISHKNDLTAYIYGNRLISRIRKGINSVEDGHRIKDTLTKPNSVFLADDGDHLYFRSIGYGVVYYVRMRVSDGHVCVLPARLRDLTPAQAVNSGRSTKRNGHDQRERAGAHRAPAALRGVAA